MYSVYVCTLGTGTLGKRVAGHTTEVATFKHQQPQTPTLCGRAKQRRLHSIPLITVSSPYYANN